jgi:aminoglycoside phosphotransferase (APT) family kinase protein
MARDLNTTAPPRAGEELDAARLTGYLSGKLPHGVENLVVEQFPAGHSNLTYLLKTGDHEYVLRRPPFGTKVKSAHDMGREYRVLSQLHPVYPPAPRPLLYCEDLGVIGAPFYLMERMRGLVIRKTLPEYIGTSPELCRRLSFAFIDNLAALHAIDLKAAGRDGFGKPEGYVRRQIEGWSTRWAGSKTEEVPEMDQLAAWLGERMPSESGAAVIHNDYKFDNVLVDPDDVTRITGVLDWEMATVGDPLMDLGTALSYWIDADDRAEFQALRFSPTCLAGFPSRAEILDRYRQVSGRDVPHANYYYVYGLFKLAVILQQIYYRYVHGLTSDVRFAAFRESVLGLARQGVEAYNRGK